MSFSIELRTALEAARQAESIVRASYRRRVDVRSKEDGSPVTAADVHCERVIREMVEERFPNHGFYGEETSARDLQAESLWLVDPIDGTKAFVRGYPMFSTQIALMRAGEIVLGVSSAPLYGELAFAERGRGARLNDRPLRVSTIGELAEAALSAGNLKTLAGSAAWARYGGLVGRVNRIRGYGDFLHYHLLAAGKIDAVIESDVNILDIAACAAIVAEAGGRFTELDGGALTLNSTTVLATNGPLHSPILESLRWAAERERGGAHVEQQP